MHEDHENPSSLPNPAQPTFSLMAVVEDTEKYCRNRELYNALMRGDEVQVFELCKQIPDGPFHEVTIHKDTVLHMATYSKQIGLVIGLLSKFSDDGREKLTIVNDVGNTILHEAATTNKILPAAEKMLELAPELLTMRNFRGETALFRAAHYGKTEIFEFLAKEMDKLSESDRKLCLQRGDDTTILHIAVLAEHFELAIWIANKYRHLINAPDGDDMTALQLLTFNPTAFRSGSKLGFFREFIYSWISSDDTNKQEDGEVQKMKSYNPISLIVDFVKSTCNFPLCEEVQKEKQRHDSALKLAKLLIEKDTSWEATKTAKDLNKPRMHKHGDTFKVPENEEEGRSVASSSKDLEGTVRAWGTTLSQVEAEEEDLGERYSIEKTRETPLFLATKTGIVEIVEEILRLYPQAVEHINDKGRNILHIAIKHRRREIFNLVERMEMPMKRLIRKIDNNGNSILHMVGAKRNHRMTEKMQNPALQLQEELLLFEQVKEVSKTYFVKHYNNEKQTAEKLFVVNNDQLRSDAQEWLKRTSENCSIVAVLIATVAFAAAYTIPGGPNQSTGFPILQNQPFFEVFTLTDVLSLTFALTSVVKFLSILTSPYQLKDFKQSLPRKLMLGLTFLVMSVSMMMLSFAATIILMISNRERWTKVALYTVALLPVTMFALSYLPLYSSLMRTFTYSLKCIGKAFPRCSCFPPSLNSIPKSQTTNESQPTRSNSIACQLPASKANLSPV